MRAGKPGCGPGSQAAEKFPKVIAAALPRLVKAVSESAEGVEKLSKVNHPPPDFPNLTHLALNILQCILGERLCHTMHQDFLILDLYLEQPASAEIWRWLRLRGILKTITPVQVLTIWQTRKLINTSVLEHQLALMHQAKQATPSQSAKPAMMVDAPNSRGRGTRAASTIQLLLRPGAADIAAVLEDQCGTEQQ